MNDDLSVYLHVPFCRAKCPYCDFYSVRPEQSPIAPAAYFELVERELELLVGHDRRLRDRRVVSLYVGGGTPSLIAPEHYRRFFHRLRGKLDIATPLEWTVEINPETLVEPDASDRRHRATSDRFQRFLALGINRLSIGVQSFCDATVEQLGRSHRSDQARFLLDLVRRHARSTELLWGIDLIFGAPGQTLDLWRADIEQALEYRPHHLSVYGLTVHEGTPFAERRRRGELDLPDEETQRAMFLLARRSLTRAGYEHYEIANYALPGMRSRHNERYWTGDDYLGLGAAAHSFVGGVRWANPSDLALYAESIESGRLARRIEPSPEGRARVGELVMLGLRRLEGIDLTRFRARWGVDLRKDYAPEIDRLTTAGLVEVARGRLRLTDDGLLVADAVMAEFF